jgi:hypothetical protein
MTDEQRLDWLERSMRQQIGGGTPERLVACEVHMGKDIRWAVDEAARCYPQGRNPDLDKGA